MNSEGQRSDDEPVQTKQASALPIFPALLGSVSTNFIMEVVCLQMVGTGDSQYFSAFVF
jgi:hypothetical protein